VAGGWCIRGSTTVGAARGHGRAPMLRLSQRLEGLAPWQELQAVQAELRAQRKRCTFGTSIALPTSVAVPTRKSVAKIWSEMNLP
jgi:hypothetical protein